MAHQNTHPHGSESHNVSFSIIDRLAMRLIQDRIIAVSDVLADELSNEFPREKICVIENGIDLNIDFQSSQQSYTPLRT